VREGDLRRRVALFDKNFRMLVGGATFIPLLALGRDSYWDSGKFHRSRNRSEELLMKIGIRKQCIASFLAQAALRGVIKTRRCE
jgi:hypothetical protein